MIKKLISFFLFFLVTISFSWSQLYVEPLPVVKNKGITHSNPNLRLATEETTSLFFEDFYQFTSFNDNTNWDSVTGVRVNNTIGKNPPNQFYAVFDGQDANLDPYNFAKPYSQGLADSLQSKSIDLSKYKSDSLLTFNFYFQRAALGDKPDSLEGDSLILHFYGKDNKWHPVWNTNTSKIDTTWNSVTQVFDSVFTKVNFLISDSLYFHPNFKFKFANYGRLSGQWDVWCVDYIQILTKSELSIGNLTILNPPSSVLKNYTAMPFEQIKGNVMREFKDSISIDFGNVSNTSGIFLIPKIDFYNNNSYINTYKYVKGVNDSIIFLPKYPSIYTLKVPIYDSLYSSLNDSTIFSYKTTAIFNDFGYNEQSTQYTNLTNYYSYDDGSSEWAFGINQAAGRLIQKFELNRLDTITSVQISWVKASTDVAGSTFKVLVLDSNFNVLSNSQASLIYGSDSMPFYDYKLDSALIIPKGKFYVGFEQNTSKILTVGFDVNNNFQKNILFAVNYIQGTNQYNYQPVTKYPGALMMRPVFKRNASVIKGQYNTTQGQRKELEIYPNPNQGVLNFNFENAEILSIYDSYGKSIYFETEKLSSSQILLHIPKGMYVMKLNFEGSIVYKKIFID